MHWGLAVNIMSVTMHTQMALHSLQMMVKLEVSTTPQDGAATT